MAATMQEKYDSAFLGILQHEGQIANFLDAIFSFLYRRTDFYLIMKNKEDKMGFPPGVALKIVVAAYKRYEELAKKREELIEQQQKTFEEQERARKEQQASADAQPEASMDGVPTAVRTEEVSCENMEASGQAGTEPVKSAETSASPDQKEAEKDTSDSKMDTETTEAAGADSSQKETREVEKKEQTVQKSGVKTKTTERKEKPDDDPELKRMQKQFQDNPESYNGAIRDNYSWSQSITDLDVRIKIPQHIKKGKDVQVVIQRKHLKASYRGPDGNWVTVVDDALTWDVHKEECIWSLVPGEHIHVNLEKMQERWWEAVLESEPHINVRNIEPSRPMADLDEEAQAKIQEMMYNERQKQLGLPQSHEQKVHDMLKSAWDAEGSPFKGQPFDPSKLNVSPSGVADIKP